MILAIETSDILCSIAFWDSGRTILEYNLELPQQHATLVGSLVEQGFLFLSAPERTRTYSRDDIALLAVSIGPGSFTGLRIGLSFAQGFCSTGRSGIVGVSNHQVLAAQRLKIAEELFTIIEARRNEVYMARHEIVSNTFTQIASHDIVSKSELVEMLPAGAQLVFSKDLKMDAEDLDNLRAKDIKIVDSARFIASVLAGLAEEKQAIHGTDSPAEIEPLYIRPFAGAL